MKCKKTIRFQETLSNRGEKKVCLLFVAEFAITILRQEAAAMSEHPVSRKATLFSHGPLLMPETGPARHGMYEQLQLEITHPSLSSHA